MLLAYMDEAGNTGADLAQADQPIHYVGALLVPEAVWLQSLSDMRSIVRFANECGFNEERGCELHGSEVCHAPKKSGWRDVSVADRLEIFSRAIKVAEDHRLSLVYGACDKVKLAAQYKYPEHPHRLAAWLCFERIADIAVRTGQLAVLVADDGPPAQKDLIRKTLDDYRTFGPPFGPKRDLSVIVDTAHFLDSGRTLHLQLCDLMLYVLNRYKTKQDARFAEMWDRCRRRIAASQTMPY